MAARTSMAQCANCAKTGSDLGVTLKRCSRCGITCYCSRECQKADWKEHKKGCASKETSTSSTDAGGQPPNRPSASIDKPFHRLDSRTWLHDRPEKDVYELLIDTYRLRMEDNYKLEGNVDADCVYNGAPDGQQGFRRFLRLAEKRPGLLPSWWSQEKAAACVTVGRNGGWSSLSSMVEKGDVIEHYGDPNMPMQLRMFGEQVYGRGPGGQSGDGMRQVQMMLERGGKHSTLFNMAGI